MKFREVPHIFLEGTQNPLGGTLLSFLAGTLITLAGTLFFLEETLKALGGTAFPRVPTHFNHCASSISIETTGGPYRIVESYEENITGRFMNFLICTPQQNYRFSL